MIDVQNIETMQTYLKGMFKGRPGEHHARIKHATGVSRSLVCAIVGGVLLAADPGSIAISERMGRAGNVAWFSVRGHHYVLAYNRSRTAGGIDLRDRYGVYRVIATFRDTALDQIGPVFDAL